MISQPIVSQDLINQAANLNLDSSFSTTNPDGDEIDPATAGISSEMSNAIDNRVENLMERVSVIMNRASQRTRDERRAAAGNSNGEVEDEDDETEEREIELTEEEKDEMRAVVGEEVMKQILEGWNGGDGGSEWEESDDDEDEEEEK